MLDVSDNVVVKEIIQKTIDFFKIPGNWIKNRANDEKGSCCLMGGIEKFCPDFARIQFYDMIKTSLDKYCLENNIYNSDDTEYCSIFKYNDHPNTTVEDIIHILEEIRKEFK